MHYVISRKVIQQVRRQIPIDTFFHLQTQSQNDRWLEKYQSSLFKPVSKITPQNNVFIPWESTKVDIYRRFFYLGVTTTDPNKYEATFGTSLVEASQIPAYANALVPPNGLRLAADGQNSLRDD